MTSSSLPDDTTPASTSVEELSAASSLQNLSEASLTYITNYRAQLMELKQKAQEGYDKTILTLSASSLGISFAFVKDIVPLDQAEFNILLLIAWICWGFSLAAVLFAYYMSHQAFRDAIKQVDNALNQGNLIAIYQTHLGGWKDRATSFLNASAGVLFIAGVALLIIFISRNIV
ncbi:MAG: hypothetical protein AAF564_25445 [Bacteroidota bacterium]